jgi:hypothetical protein
MAIHLIFIHVSPPLVGLGSLPHSLFVADVNPGSVAVGKFKVNTPHYLLGLLAPAENAYGLAFFGDKVFVGDVVAGTISKWNAGTSKLINASFITGLSSPWQIAVLDDKLFVANGNAGTVGEYNAKTGAVINAAFISLPTEPVGIAVKAQASSAGDTYSRGGFVWAVRWRNEVEKLARESPLYAH